MRIREVDFPAEILDAQRTNTLVIFAGAGISIDPPSNLPDFNGLANRIGGSIHPRLEGEAIDRYFGRLVGIGVTVHEQVRSILSSPDSRPNLLHEALIGIFGEPKDVRLVTTNFDRHFTTAAIKRFGTKCPEVFWAPALPVGGNFDGIVHLHGSVERAPDRLVLTDADFGRAYITEAWAAQFLQRLFSRYVILFVGYSHQDMLLSYLARGFTAGSLGPGRFAFTQPDEDERWKNLGITPVPYPLCTSPQAKHLELGVALSAWAEQSNAGALDAEKRIKSIAEAGVPLVAEDRDYMKHSLSEISTLRFFTRYATGLEWLSWIEGQNAFQRLFTTQGDYSDADSLLAYWFAEHFALKHAEEALDLLRRKHLNLSPVLWGAIAQVLFQKKPGDTVLSKWVPVLLSTAPRQRRGELLEYILSDCVYPRDEVPALLLLEHLTKPILELKEGFRLSEAATEGQTVTDAELATAGSGTWLQRAWTALFSPNLDYFARRLAPMVTFHLMTARLLLQSFDRVNANWDPISYSRGMIESRQQDHLHSGMSVLLDIAADVMRWACVNDHRLAEALIAQWATTESLILQRLAIFGLSAATHISADDKLEWLLQRGLLFRFGMKHETFLLLRTAYPQATLASRARLLEQVAEGPELKKEHQDVGEYEVFNLVAWLARSAPSCELAGKLLAQLREQHPNYGVREHPDMDSWIGSAGAVAWQSPGGSEDLLSFNLDQLQEALANAPERRFPDGVSREDLLQRIANSARKSISWGLDIARQARNRSLWTADIWNALIGAWTSTDLTEENWESVLGVLGSSPAVHVTAADNITFLLERGIQSTSAPIPVAMIAQAKSLADQIWRVCEEIISNKNAVSKDWLATAINHPAGRLMEFYLHCLSKLQQNGSHIAVTVTEYERIFDTALEGTWYADELARVVLASQMYFLFHISEDWTVQHVFPLLDSNIDLRRAEQCWHGFLYWGSWSNPMLKHLLGYYELRFPLLKEESDDMRRTFCGHLAGIAIYALVHPLEEGWLLRFISAVEPKTRALWASQMRSGIQSLDEAAKVNLWRRWLKDYWEERLQGMPVPLDSDESGEMFEWALDLDPVLPEVVDLICAGPYPDLRNAMAYYPIAKSDLLKQHPEAVAKLLAFLAAGERGRPIYDLDQLRDAVERLITLIPSYTPLRPLCDDLARLGVAGVADLVARLA